MSLCQLSFLREEPSERRPFVHRCQVCGAEVRSKHSDPAMYHRECGSAVAQSGPGTCLLQIFRELSITPKKGCDCEKLRKAMDVAGVDGCRARKAEFIDRLQANAAKFGLADWTAAGWQAVKQGKPLTLAGLYDLAVDRAANRATD